MQCCKHYSWWKRSPVSNDRYLQAMMLLLPRYYKFASYASNSKNIFEFDEPVSISWSFSLQITYILHNVRKILSLYFVHRKVLQARVPDFTKEIVKPSFFWISTRPSSIFYTGSSMILGTLAPLQKSHGVKDIAMRHWGVLRSSVREVGYLVVSSHTLPMLSTQIPFLHVYTDILYIKEKK